MTCGGQNSAKDHERHPEDCNALIAETLAEQSARIGDHYTREQIETNEQTELRVVDA
jgi:hypothetical protein